jgi:hypothetical protein
MGIVNLYKAIRKKLDDWKDNYPSDCGFIIKVNEYIIEGMSSFEESYYLVMVDISYKSYKGVSKFFRMEHKDILDRIGPQLEMTVNQAILSNLSELLDKGKLDSIKDGTFRGWGV